MCNCHTKNGIHYGKQYLLMIPNRRHHLISTIHVLHNSLPIFFFFKKKLPTLNWKHATWPAVERVRFADAIEWSKWFPFFILFGFWWWHKENAECVGAHKMYSTSQHTCIVYYNHSIRCQLNSLNFQMTTSNLKGIYRFILEKTKTKRIQHLCGDGDKGEKTKSFWTISEHFAHLHGSNVKWNV